MTGRLQCVGNKERCHSPYDPYRLADDWPSERQNQPDDNKRAVSEAHSPPDNGIYLLPEGEGEGREWRRFRSTTGNAANFGFANRMFLGLMLQNAVENRVHPFEMKLLYDSPHNFIWEKESEGRKSYIHRKGACSARGMAEMEGTPFAYYGEPVMIPGSMGSSSYLLRGMGNPDALWSASHGAGRRLSRGRRSMAVTVNSRNL